MGSGLKVTICLLGSYVVACVMMLCLAGIYSAVMPEDCGDDHAEGCGFGGAFMLLITTFHGTTWGHMAPVTKMQEFIACIVASMGYLWPLAMAVLILALASQEKLAKRGALAIVSLYSVLSLPGNLIISIIMTLGDGGMAEEGIGRVFYFSWMTLHSRSYGDIYPHSGLEDICTIIVQLAGSAVWLFPLLIVVRSAACNTVSWLQSPVRGKTLLHDFVVASLFPYFIASILFFSGIYMLLDPQDCDEWNSACGYDNALFLLLTTFHGNTFGHMLPRTDGQAAVACIIAALGFLWRHVVAISVLRIAQQPVLAKIAAVALCLTYTFLAFAGNLAFTGIIVASDGPLCTASQRLRSEWDNATEATGERDGCFFGGIFYYVWLSFHGRAYGELTAGSTLEDTVSVCVVVSNASCWLVPLLAVLRRASFIGILEGVPSCAPATMLGVRQQNTSSTESPTVSDAPVSVTPASIQEPPKSKTDESRKVVGNSGDSCEHSNPKIAARRDREAIPAGMALIEIKDRTEGDTAENMVIELYRQLVNGAERANGIQASFPDGRAVFVPESDLSDLHRVWHGDMQLARRRVEEQFRQDGIQRRAPRMLFFRNDGSGSATTYVHEGLSAGGSTSSESSSPM